MNSFSHVIVHKIRQIDNLAMCHPCNVVFNCLEMWHIPVLAGFWPILGLVSSLVPRLPSASCSGENHCWVSTRVLISPSITYLPTSSHIFRKPVREHTCLVCSIKRIKNTLMGRVLSCQNVITYLDWNFPLCRLSIFKP